MAFSTSLTSGLSWLSDGVITPADVSSSTIYTAQSMILFYNESTKDLAMDTLSTSGTGYEKIAEVSIAAAAAGSVAIKKIIPVDGTYGWKLNSANLADFELTAENDNVTISSGATGLTSITGAANGGNDTISFAADKQLTSLSGAVAASSSIKLQSADEENYVVLGATSDMASGTLKGSASGITLGSATGQVLKEVTTGGNVTINLDVAASDSDITVENGTTSLVAGNSTASTSKVSVKGGELAYGAVAVFGEGSSITDATLKSADVSLKASGAITLAKGEISGAFSIDGRNSDAESNVEITKLGNAVSHSIGSAASLNLQLAAGADSLTDYYKVSNGVQDATIYSGNMNITRNGTAFDIIGISNSAEKKEWSLGRSTATISATTGTTSGNDEVTLSGAQAKTTLKTGTGADTIKLATDVNNTSIDGGAGDDVFDISSRAKGTAASVVVENFGVGGTKNTASDSTVGFDKIFVGTSFNADNDASYNTGTNTLTIRGVEFTVNDGSYVLIGKYDSATSTTVFDSYLAEDGALTLAAEDVTPSTDTTSTTGYNVADSTATIELANPDELGTAANATAANNTFKNAGTNDIKFLGVADGDTWTTTIDMTSNGTSYVQIEKGATAAGAIKMGKSNENNVVLIDNTADLSSVSFSDYKSTKDVIISKQLLDNYSDTAKYDTNNFISSTDGSFGSDLVGKGGSLTASSLKGGLYGAKYRQADIINDQVKTIYNEVLVVAGASAAGSYDATNATTQIFAMTNNNDTIADSVTGSKYDDVFVAGAGDVIDGGAGNDVIYADEKKVTVKLATGSTADQDTINNWKSGSGTIQLTKGVEFSAISVTDFGTVASQMIVGDGTGTNTKATFNTSGFANNAFVTTFKSDDTTKNALIYGAGGFNAGGAVATAADSVASAKLYVGAGNAGQLDFTGTGKGNIFLGHSEGTSGEFGDTAQYVNVKNVKSDSVGSAWVFGGSTKAQLTAGGDSDSLWGGGKNADTLRSNDTYRTFFGTTNGSGIDSVVGFKTGADAFGETTDTDVIYFVDGVDMSSMKVSNGNFIVGSNSSSGLAISIADMAGDSTTNGALITYALGLDGKKNVAKVDVTTDNNTNGEVTFEEDAQLYIGRGDKTTITFGENNGNAVRFGFESQYSGYNVRNLDATDAVAGSLVNGSTDRAQRVKASEKGASSIAGGFGDGFKDGNSDTLVGGNDDSFGTTFFVGKDMGSDQILQLSGNDTVVFLNTKLSDITNNVNTDTYGKTMSVVFNTGSRVSINSDNNIADLENVTLQLADGKFTYDATAKSWVQA